MSPDLPSLDQLLAVARTGTLPIEFVVTNAELLTKAGRATDATLLYEAWLTHTKSPARAVALFNWGVLLSDQGQLDAAEAAYTQACALNPRLHQARVNGGLIQERKKNDAAALRLWLDVAAAGLNGQADALPFATIALNHVGRLQEARKHYAAAEAALASSLRLAPRQADAIQHWVHLRQKQCTWPVYAPPPGLTVHALMAATSPLAALAQCDDPAMQWLAALSFVHRKYPMKDDHPRPPRPAHDRIRIGYLSGDLCTHAVGLLLPELIEAHDRSRFHVTAFDFSPQDGTAHRARLMQAFDDVVDIRALDDAAAADAIRSRGIDVLLDLHGLSSGARPGVLARRPAPLIGTYLGFIGTTTLPWVDFVVTDRWTLPEALAPYYSERPLYIDGSLIPLHHAPVPVGRIERHAVGLPNGAFVLASFNNAYKFTPDLFACWMRILHRCPNAVLWLLDDNPWATAALRARATEAGIDATRVVFAGRCPHAEYRERLALADLYLDTYPYNAGSTARDVLDAGVPLVTMSGRTAVSRMAGSLLHAAGASALVTGHEAEYEDLAVGLYGDPERLRAIRQDLAARAPSWQDAPLRLVRSLEAQLPAWLDATGRGPGVAPR
jgi:predicted O-linked N-acetylglucosamine transferase (SPINDLY family)